MRLLLDSHALLWWLSEDAGLAAEADAVVRDPQSLVVVSAATVWEIGIKQALGKLRPPERLLERISAERFTPLAISPEHAVEAAALPRHHDDPFDRMLVAQARLEGLTLVTRDARISAYDVVTLPA